MFLDLFFSSLVQGWSVFRIFMSSCISPLTARTSCRMNALLFVTSLFMNADMIRCEPIGPPLTSGEKMKRGTLSSPLRKWCRARDESGKPPVFDDRRNVLCPEIDSYLRNPHLSRRIKGSRIPSLIRGGDLARMLEKRYSGDLSTRSPAVKTPPRPPFLGMAMVGHKILMVRLITVRKHSCRITGIKG